MTVDRRTPDLPLRLGILGTASIARPVVAGLAQASNVTVLAIASRDGAKARAFAEEFGIAAAHGSYEALLADPDVDAVYIPLPNALHAQWAICAAEAGKHVICEKPLATSAAEARAMFAAADANGVRLVEAYPYLAQPQMMGLRQMIADGAIGRVRTITASFGFTLPGEDDIRFDPALGGGAMLDAGSYPLSLIRVLAGAAPLRVHAVARWGDTGIDRALIANLEHEDGLLAQFSCTFDAGLHRHALIIGDGGVIETGYPNHTNTRPSSFRIVHGASFTPEVEDISFPQIDGFLAEMEAAAAMITSGERQWPGVDATQSIDIARTLEAIARSAKTGVSVDLADI
jgi:predicted dehydrogenase